MTPTTSSRARARRCLAAAGALLAALALSACSASAPAATPDATAPAAQDGGTVRLMAISETAGFDPTRVGSIGVGMERAVAIMDTLLFRDEQTDEVHPRLAAGIASEDGKVWVLTLREGVTFTDGEPLDAEAVVFNIERHLAPDSRSQAKSMLSGLASVQATGPLEVTFTLTEPSGSFPLALTGYSPAGLIGSPAALADPEAFNSAPVGAGPFMLDEWVPDDTLTLVRNPDYWRDGLPHLDEVVYRIIPNTQARADALLSDGVDIATIAATNWTQVAGNPAMRLHLSPTGGQALIVNVSTPTGQDERVREAISLAFDSETTARIIFGGLDHWGGDTSCIPFPSGSPACGAAGHPEQDVERARELIADFVADGGDPALTMVFGQSLADQAGYFQQELTAIGLEVELRSVDITGLTEAQATGDYGILVASTASAGYPTVWNRLSSTGTNWGMTDFPELQAALLEARDALTIEERNDAWRRVSQIVADERYLYWMAPQFQAIVHHERVQLDREGFPYAGSTLIYLDEAWLTD